LNNPLGAIRGQIYPTVAAGLRRLPLFVNTIVGQTIGSAATLRHANSLGHANNPSAYVRCQPTLVSTAGNVTAYQGIFYFSAGLTKRNIDSVRGLSMELNLRGQGQPYLFEIFNNNNGTWSTMGIFNGTILWTPAFSLLNTINIGAYINSRSQMLFRISSVGPRPLFIDLMGVRLYHARSLSSQIIRQYQKYLQHLPSH